LNNVIKCIGCGDSSLTNIYKLAFSIHNSNFLKKFIGGATVQNIRCFTSLDEEYELHGSGSVSPWDKDRRHRHPPLMPEIGGDRRWPNKLHTDSYKHKVTVKEFFSPHRMF